MSNTCVILPVCLTQRSGDAGAPRRTAQAEPMPDALSCSVIPEHQFCAAGPEE